MTDEIPAGQFVPIGYPDTPAPGSPDAVDQGCRCPIRENHMGRGINGDGSRHMWLILSTCPLHHRPFIHQADEQ